MSSHDTKANLNAVAKVSPIKQLSVIWLIPVLSVLIGMWMIYDYVSHQGPEITLHLSRADGIEAGKTLIKSRNVKLGTITSVSLSKDFQSIIAKAQMTPEAKRMMKEDTRFWVVKPRIGKGGISGLDTLLSGAYIALEPGISKKNKVTFEVLDTPPVASQHAKGLRLMLTKRSSGKLVVGDPILYEGFTVGHVESVEFSPQQKRAQYQIFIMSPFDKLVHSNTKFWVNSGMKMNLNSKGLNLDIGSIETLLTGGISFSIPDGQQEGALVSQSMAKFDLYDSQELAQASVFNKYAEFVMLFDESIRGLNVGAPVEYRGVPIGYVAKVPLELEKVNDHFSQHKLPVLVRIELARIFQDYDKLSVPDFTDMFKQEFVDGLRGTLKTGSLLTGALFIDTDMYPNKELWDKNTTYSGYPVFPTKVAGVAELQKKFGQLIDKFNNLPLENTVNTINHTMKQSDKAFAAFTKTNQELSSLLAKPSTQQLPESLQKSLVELQRTLQGYGPDSQTYQDLESSMQQLNQTLEQLNPLIKQLNQKPNSMVFGKDSQGDPIPVGGQH